MIRQVLTFCLAQALIFPAFATEQLEDSVTPPILGFDSTKAPFARRLSAKASQVREGVFNDYCSKFKQIGCSDVRQLLSSYSEEFEQEDWFVVRDAYRRNLRYRAKMLEDCIMDVYIEIEPIIVSDKAKKAVSACHNELKSYAKTVLPLFGWSPTLSQKTADRISDDEWKKFLIEEFHTRNRNSRVLIQYRNRLFGDED